MLLAATRLPNNCSQPSSQLSAKRTCLKPVAARARALVCWSRAHSYRSQLLTQPTAPCPQFRLQNSASRVTRTGGICHAATGSEVPGEQSIEQDANQLVTQLNVALAQEDYARASKLRDQLKALQGTNSAIADWREYDCPEWLADRAEKLGFRFPTGMTVEIRNT